MHIFFAQNISKWDWTQDCPFLIAPSGFSCVYINKIAMHFQGMKAA
jgi:hypothetical protein